MNKPFSQACENNKQAILQVISNYFKAGDRILEVGSGTAQHAIYFCSSCQKLVGYPVKFQQICLR